MNNRAALYLRLSDEDKNKLSKEELSESIKNQELLLKNYAIREGFNIIGIYSDEDWSGSDATRPNFNKMINECKKGNVDIVICKTQARFARDSELIEKYVHNLFHEWNVRFITAVDKIDNSKKETKKTSQILGLTDEWYLEDTSLNIRDTLKAKREKGQFTGSFTKYGYIKDPEDKNHLIPDSVAKETVKKIFNNYILGFGLDKIATDLNNQNILCPIEYKKINGSKLQTPLLKNYLNYDYIEKSGTYIIDVCLFNNKNLTNVKLFNYIATNDKKFSKNLKIQIKNYSNNLLIYYSTSENIDDNTYKLYKENDILPENITYIKIYINQFNKVINYQFEVTLKENKNHDKFYFNISNNIDLKEIVNIRKKMLWSSQTIKSILKDEVYIGNLVQFKTTTVSYKNHTIIKNSIDNQIRKNNTHEAIIDKNIFYLVQDKLKNKTRSCFDGKIHPLSNKIYCNCCNNIFSKTGRKINNEYSYLCCKDKNTKWANCDNKKYIREDDLHKFIINKINILFEKFYDEMLLDKIKDSKIENNLFKEQYNNLNKEFEQNFINIENKNKYFQQLYEDRLNGLISDKNFFILTSRYNDDISKLEKRQAEIKKELSLINKRKQFLKSTNIFKKYKKISVLTPNSVSFFINRLLSANIMKI